MNRRSRHVMILASLAAFTLCAAVLLIFGKVMEAQALGGAQWLDRIDRSDWLLLAIVGVQTAVLWRLWGKGKSKA